MTTAIVPVCGWVTSPAPIGYRPNAGEALRLASAYNEGAYSAVRRMVDGDGAHPLTDIGHDVALARAPSYHELRRFLVDDYETDPIIAARAALSIDASNQRSRKILRDLRRSFA